jgi:hypothetical protein
MKDTVFLTNENVDAIAKYTYNEETLETAGCTGGCESFKDGLPECEKCSQFGG